jgi:hypothetical protein
MNPCFVNVGQVSRMSRVEDLFEILLTFGSTGGEVGRGSQHDIHGWIT